MFLQERIKGIVISANFVCAHLHIPLTAPAPKKTSLSSRARAAPAKMPPARRSKRKAAAPGEAVSKRSRTMHERASLDSIRALLRDFEDSAPERSSVWLCLESVLDSTPFGSSLTKHGHPGGTNSVSIVTRAYEEQFLRECHLDEDTPCIMGEFCECQATAGFTGVAFVLPTVSTVNPRMCVLCIRKTTQMLFYRIIASGHSTSQMVQFYGNIAGVPGEYNKQAMLVVPPGGPVHCMPLPVVAHQRNRYFPITGPDGVRRIGQRDVYYENF